MKHLLVLMALSANVGLFAQEFVYDTLIVPATNDTIELIMQDRPTIECGMNKFELRTSAGTTNLHDSLLITAYGANVYEMGESWLLQIFQPNSVQLSVFYGNAVGSRSHVKSYELGTLCAGELNLSDSTKYTNVPEVIYDSPDIIPEYPGGKRACLAFIDSTLQYPQYSTEMEDQGNVFLKFIVEKDGEITQVVIERGVTRELDSEAKRIVGAMPNWIPAQMDGKPVRSVMRFYITFELE